MKEITKESIEKSLQKHHNLGLEIFKLPVTLQERYLEPVLKDLTGISDTLMSNDKNTEAFCIDNEKQNTRLSSYLDIIDELRLKYIQRFPENAIENLTKKEVISYIQYAHFIEEPETLFYNTEHNMSIINEVVHTLSGSYFEGHFKMLITPVFGYPDIQISHPKIRLFDIESLDSFIDAMKQAIIKVDKAINEHKDRFLKIVAGRREKAEIENQDI